MCDSIPYVLALCAPKLSCDIFERWLLGGESNFLLEATKFMEWGKRCQGGRRLQRFAVSAHTGTCVSFVSEPPPNTVILAQSLAQRSSPALLLFWVISGIQSLSCLLLCTMYGIWACAELAFLLLLVACMQSNTLLRQQVSTRTPYWPSGWCLSSDGNMAFSITFGLASSRSISFIAELRLWESLPPVSWLRQADVC